MEKLKPVLTFAVGALKFISEWVGKILNGLVTFISWGMDAYDATMGLDRRYIWRGCSGCC